MGWEEKNDYAVCEEKEFHGDHLRNSTQLLSRGTICIDIKQLLIEIQELRVENGHQLLQHWIR